MFLEQSPKKKKEVQRDQLGKLQRFLRPPVQMCVFPFIPRRLENQVLAVDSRELILPAAGWNLGESAELFFLRVPATTFAVEFCAEVSWDGGTLLVEWPPADCSLGPWRELGEKLAQVTSPAAPDNQRWRRLWEGFLMLLLAILPVDPL